MSTRFEEKCASRTDEIVQNGMLRFVVCVDGSDAADVAFKAVMNMRKKYDFVAAFHAVNDKRDENEFVQPNFRPSAIESRYECELVSRLPPERYAVVLANRGDYSFLQKLEHSVSRFEDSRLITDMHSNLPDFIVFG